MPELPEVETVCRGLKKAVLNRQIDSIQLRRSDLRIPFPTGLKDIRRVKITDIDRRAKYILMHLGDKQTMIVHLGMSGSLTIMKNVSLQKHDHMILTLDDKTKIVFNDPRRFGLVDLTKTKNIDQHRFFRHLGPEPLEKEFTAAYLAEKLKGKKAPVKLAIMDQRLVVGVGNIYASEALFEAGIDPRRESRNLQPPEIRKLTTAIRDVLKRAIKAGGSSLRDYVQANGELGYFQHQWAVYGRESQSCKGCARKETILKVQQGGRATFFCPACQK